MRIRLVALAAALALLIVFPAIVSAHAQLTASTPTADSTVDAFPPEIVLTFDDPLLAETSSFEVIDATGASVLTGSVDATDAHVMRATAGPLGAGAFEVRWTAATDDGHIERGTFGFTVTAGADPTATPAPATPPTSDSQSGSAVIVPIVAAVVIVGGGLAFFLRRRKQAA